MPNFTRHDILRMTESIQKKASADKTPPEEAFIKYAKQYNLPPAVLKDMLDAYNTVRQLDSFHKKANRAEAPTPLNSAEIVRAYTSSTVPEVKTASVKVSTWGKPEIPMTKSASFRPLMEGSGSSFTRKTAAVEERYIPRAINTVGDPENERSAHLFNAASQAHAAVGRVIDDTAKDAARIIRSNPQAFTRLHEAILEDGEEKWAAVIDVVEYQAARMGETLKKASRPVKRLMDAPDGLFKKFAAIRDLIDEETAIVKLAYDYDDGTYTGSTTVTDPTTGESFVVEQMDLSSIGPMADLLNGEPVWSQEGTGAANPHLGAKKKDDHEGKPTKIIDDSKIKLLTGLPIPVLRGTDLLKSLTNRAIQSPQAARNKEIQHFSAGNYANQLETNVLRLLHTDEALQGSDPAEMAEIARQVIKSNPSLGMNMPALRAVLREAAQYGGSLPITTLKETSGLRKTELENKKLTRDVG